MDKGRAEGGGRENERDAKGSNGRIAMSGGVKRGDTKME